MSGCCFYNLLSLSLSFNPKLNCGVIIGLNDTAKIYSIEAINKCICSKIITFEIFRIVLIIILWKALC